jgi:hypothetical protein
MLQRGLLGENETLPIWQRVGVVFGEDLLNLSGCFDIFGFRDSGPVIVATVTRFRGEKLEFRLSCSDLAFSVIEIVQTRLVFNSELFPLIDLGILGSRAIMATGRSMACALRYESERCENTRVSGRQSRPRSGHGGIQGGGEGT